MKTLYKNTRLIAAAIVGSLVLSAGAAVALTKDTEPKNAKPVSVDNVGRFVVTPKGTQFVPPAESVGRFVISQHGAVFVPVAPAATV
jgi:hypothetical protein